MWVCWNCGNAPRTTPGNCGDASRTTPDRRFRGRPLWCQAAGLPGLKDQLTSLLPLSLVFLSVCLSVCVLVLIPSGALSLTLPLACLRANFFDASSETLAFAVRDVKNLNNMQGVAALLAGIRFWGEGCAPEALQKHVTCATLPPLGL